MITSPNMAARHPPRNRQKDAKDNKDRGAATALPAGTKGYKKIHITELPIIDVNSGPNIPNIRDAPGPRNRAYCRHIHGGQV